MATTDIQLFQHARQHADRTAIIDGDGSFTYSQMLDASGRIATRLLDGRDDLAEHRVAFLAPPSFHYVATQWAIWRAGGVAVPLATSHPTAELEKLVDDAQPLVLIAHPAYAQTLQPIALERGIRFHTTTATLESEPTSLPHVDVARRAMMIYTSGTTGKAKGVVTTHSNIQAQVTALISAWGWTDEDRTLSALPLHHVHGILAVLTSALWAGACCHMMRQFDAAEVWRNFQNQTPTIFMGVPTMYHKLINAWESSPEDVRAAMSESCTKLRLMISGSAALPSTILDRWREISGHTLLERYGMTEVGMALSNPLLGNRLADHVGQPLPDVIVRLVGEDGNEVAEGLPGEIQIKGPGVFLEYWQQPAETQRVFRNGWFATGDIAVLEGSSYRIMGRSSVDILKTGGYKVSALEIENVLRSHPDVEDCAVVGIDDPAFGQRICAAAELRSEEGWSENSMRHWAEQRLAPYKVPRHFLAVAALPRNAMGKVMKNHVAALFVV